ncbi:glucose 1-dehydrogenase [Paenibacillus xerothermodurans]|uniref:SDR family NAD(P)-dependent oxidoreductase n=1 Tax=Paenibacillus xerothermodurans TaxID=1977292 RepID=A0A2W1P589_PAEXE|nr:glucose 1-dehydrogenase [Paenibacillus xerothermodurans]PZE22338.1 SDR family NAD(P)-dependent oxidoreductase [Paenibacillus xerothermodurans]
MVLDSFKLDGKVAAVTGASRGIGRAMALALAEAGADIALLQRGAASSDTMEQIKSLGRECVIVPCDMGNTDEVKAAIPAVLSHYGQLDVLVNSAGIQRRSPAVDFPEDDWDEVIQVNLKSVWLLCQEAGRFMVPRKQGKIINIASLLSYQGGITVPAYAASKGAVAQLTKALANEWGQHNVNVNAIAPGYISTDMNTALMEDTVRSSQILIRIPAGRWGTPDDFKGCVVFLASDASNYVHGSMFNIDGGWMGR